MSNSFPRFSRGNRVKKSGEIKRVASNKFQACPRPRSGVARKLQLYLSLVTCNLLTCNLINANNKPTDKKEPQELQEKVEIGRSDTHIQLDRESPELLSGAIQARRLHKGDDKDPKEA
jgi:hypothetical protein